MTQYNALNKTLSNSQLNKLESGMKYNTDVTLKICLLMILMRKIIFYISCY